MSKLPADWEKLVELFTDVYGKRSFKHARYDSEHFGNALLVLKTNFIAFRVIKDRSEEWIEVRPSFIPGWIPLRSLAEHISNQQCAGYKITHELIFMEQHVLRWHKKQWLSTLRILTFKRMKLYQITIEQNDQKRYR